MFYTPFLRAQHIKGVVQAREEKSSIQNAQLVNVYTGNIAYTDSLGNFSIDASKGELVEVRMAGYLTARFRISQGHVPPFFKIFLDKLVVLNTDRFASSGLNEYQIDSVKNYELYRTTLDYPRMSAFEQVESPFTALSRSNQMKWKFQESYAMFEREKYIDFSFNENLVKQITGLEGEPLQRYMRAYRPTYEQLRNMSQYDYYTYIRVTGMRFKQMLKQGAPRNSG